MLPGALVMVSAQTMLHFQGRIFALSSLKALCLAQPTARRVGPCEQSARAFCPQQGVEGAQNKPFPSFLWVSGASRR